MVKRDGQIPTRYAFRLSYDTTIGIFEKKLAEASNLLPNSFQILCLNRAGQLMVFVIFCHFKFFYYSVCVYFYLLFYP